MKKTFLYYSGTNMGFTEYTFSLFIISYSFATITAYDLPPYLFFSPPSFRQVTSMNYFEEQRIKSSVFKYFGLGFYESK